MFCGVILFVSTCGAGLIAVLLARLDGRPDPLQSLM